MKRIKLLVTSPTPKKDGKAHPACDTRKVLDGIFWISHTGAPWKNIPNDARLAHELDEDFFYSVPFSRRFSR